MVGPIPLPDLKLTGGASGPANSTATGGIGGKSGGVYNVSGGTGIFLWAAIAGIAYLWIKRKK